MPTTIDSARALLRAHRLAEAEAAARRLIAEDPGSVDAREILVLAALARQDHAAAEAGLREILALAPDAGWARDDLARLLLDSGRPAEAEIEVRAAIAVDPGHADAHAMLGAFLSGRERLVEGAWHLRRAIALAGRHPQILANLARNLMRQGALDEASAMAAEALRAAPDLLAAAVLVVEIAEQGGDLDAAHRALDHATRLAARAGRDTLLLRATLLSQGPQWQEALALLDALPAMSGAARLLRGRLRDRAGRHGEAWADVVAGKAALAAAAGRRYDKAAVEAHFARLAAITMPDAPRPAHREGPQPLFILGMPRSGTTMAEQLLSSHGRIRAGGELPFTAELEDVAGRLTGSPFPQGFGQLSAADHHHLPALFRDVYLGRAEAYGLRQPGADFFTDKMPLNEIVLPLIRVAFPEAPLVAVRRHPLDTLVSIMMHDMTHGQDCGYRIEDAAHQLAAVSALTETYRNRLGIAPHVFCYERFVADQPGETDRLMAHVGLAAEPAQARFHENRRHAPTPSYAQVREPLHARSIGRWKNYEEQLAPILPIVDAAMQRGGYRA
ncbi:tetratricopeptide repeat-containing sulfotransferase family protein [Sphingomonas abietis]|uniref:Sulfotransferase n=1 Tax=Sphingomonas abietis TaxID=3012344 RepID=A0ABY7NPJ6_9SPHN|nr:tetratricopeptide repeat-containing sulfotransferase family protein [Sphingomonas abietis]WBO21854.1 sulfotransferase [Sphingomonas abietis]